MPNTQSASKRLRQRKVRTLRNKTIKSSIKTQVKKVLKAAEEKDLTKADVEYRLAAKKLDKASAKGVIHKNAAARKKSRLQHALKRAKAE